MYSPYWVPTISPPRSTPSLEPDSIEYEHSSPVDEYLTTPDFTEWREIRRLEYQKERQLARDTQDELPILDSPALDLCKQSPVHTELPPELPSELPPWPYTTISPEDAFPDYVEVRQYLQEQARPSSSLSEYEVLETDNDPPVCTNIGSSPEIPSPPTPLVLPSVRCIGKKAKRDEVDDNDDDDRGDPQPAPKRQKQCHVPAADVDSDIDSDDGRDQGDDDGSGSFQPSSRRPVKRQRVSAGPSNRRRTKAARSPAAPKSSTKTKCNRGEDYQAGPCSCESKHCPHCVMTCFYIFAHGQRKGEVCRRLFENGRHLDLRRHKAAHAVQEWKWLEDGEISPEEAHWHLEVFEGKEHGLICPNGDCATTFTRYDALKRHMERGTCQFMDGGPINDDLDNRRLKAKVMEASNEKYQRMTEAKKKNA